MATLSTLMICMRTDRSNAEALAVAADLARRFSAAVVGLAVRQASMHSSVTAMGPGDPPDRDVARFRDRANAAEAEFRSALSSVADLRWRAEITAGPPSQHVAGKTRAADLIVASTGPGEGIFPPSPEIDVSDLLMRAGRPVLLAPAGAAGLKLGRALVCWKDTREARRAAADALPILGACTRVDVVELADGPELEAAQRRLDDVGEWFARHGIQANCMASPLKATEAERLGAIASDLAVDVIVAGAFGRSRLSEWAFGGVTRDLLLKSDRCVLVAH